MVRLLAELRDGYVRRLASWESVDRRLVALRGRHKHGGQALPRRMGMCDSVAACMRW